MLPVFTTNDLTDNLINVDSFTTRRQVSRNDANQITEETFRAYIQLRTEAIEQTAATLMTLFNRFGTLDQATPLHKQTMSDDTVVPTEGPVLNVSRAQIIERLCAGIKRAIAEDSVRATTGALTPVRAVREPGLSAYQVQDTLDTWDSLLTNEDVDVQRIIDAVVFEGKAVDGDTLVNTLCAQFLCLCKDFLDNIYWHTRTTNSMAASSVIVLHTTIRSLLKDLADSTDIQTEGAVICCEHANRIRVAARSLNKEAHDVKLPGFDQLRLDEDVLEKSIGFSALMTGEVAWNERVMVERILYYTKESLVNTDTPLETMQHTPEFNKFLRPQDLAHSEWENEIQERNSLIPLKGVGDEFIRSFNYLQHLSGIKLDEDIGHKMAEHISVCTSALKAHIAGLRDVAFAGPNTLKDRKGELISSSSVDLMFDSLSLSKCVHTTIVVGVNKVAIIVVDKQKFRIPTEKQREEWVTRPTTQAEIQDTFAKNEHIFH